MRLKHQRKKMPPVSEGSLLKHRGEKKKKHKSAIDKHAKREKAERRERAEKAERRAERAERAERADDVDKAEKATDKKKPSKVREPFTTKQTKRAHLDPNPSPLASRDSPHVT